MSSKVSKSATGWGYDPEGLNWDAYYVFVTLKNNIYLVTENKYTKYDWG